MELVDILLNSGGDQGLLPEHACLTIYHTFNTRESERTKFLFVSSTTVEERIHFHLKARTTKDSAR